MDILCQILLELILKKTWANKHSNDSEFLNLTHNAVSVINNENKILHRIIFNNKFIVTCRSGTRDDNNGF
jgi:hypothetical protein